MRPLIFLLFFYVFPASAAPLQLLSVGDFGGFRVKAACLFGTNAQLCTLDTMGSVSIVNEGDAFAHYPVTGSEKVSGIGQDFNCDVVDITDLFLLGIHVPHFSPLRCGSDNPGFPLVGLPFFDQRTFLFDFPSATLTWDSAPPTPALPLERIGADKLWISLPGTIGGEKVSVAFDTGNPVTMVSQAFVTAHPGVFRQSLREMSPSLAQKGFVPYEISAPIVVGGVALSAPFVYAVPSSAGLFFEDAAVILGVNHAIQARWWFDLTRDLYSVQKP